MQQEDLITRPSQLRGLSATGIASFDCKARYLAGDQRPLSVFYNRAARYFDIADEYSNVFPDCTDTWQIGGFVAAREQILLDQTIRALRAGTVQNVVVLASGLSATGAYLRDFVSRELPPDQSVQIICTDLAEPLCLQRALCRHILESYTPRGVSFKPLNVLEKDDWQELAGKLSPGGVAIICEGLLGYFSMEKVTKFFSNAQALLKEHSGFLVTDIATRKGLKNTLFDGDSEKLLQQFYTVAEVKHEEVAFADGEECLDYLADHGLDAVRVGLQNSVEFYQPHLVNAHDRQKLDKILKAAVCIDVRVPSRV